MPLFQEGLHAEFCMPLYKEGLHAVFCMPLYNEGLHAIFLHDFSYMLYKAFLVVRWIGVDPD